MYTRNAYVEEVQLVMPSWSRLQRYHIPLIEIKMPLVEPANLCIRDQCDAKTGGQKCTSPSFRFLVSAFS